MPRQSKFGDMVAGVETNLHRMREAESDVRNAEVRLQNARSTLQEAETEFNDSKQALFREFPEMAPAQAPTVVVNAEPAMAAPPPAEPIPVMTSQGPVVFREMDDSPFGDGS